MPKMLKKMAHEDSAEHAARVKNYLILLSDEQVSAISYKINVADRTQKPFLMFYNEMMAERAEIKMKEAEKRNKTKACTTF